MVQMALDTEAQRNSSGCGIKKWLEAVSHIVAILTFIGATTAPIAFEIVKKNSPVNVGIVLVIVLSIYLTIYCIILVVYLCKRNTKYELRYALAVIISQVIHLQHVLFEIYIHSLLSLYR